MQAIRCVHPVLLHSISRCLLQMSLFVHVQVISALCTTSSATIIAATSLEVLTESNMIDQVLLFLP